MWATEVPSSAPTMFMTAAMSRAERMDSARVDTDVAMAFAASWKPLVKLKMSATMRIAMTSAVIMAVPIRQDSRTAIDSTVFARDSKASMAASMRSMISLRLMRLIGSISSSKSRPMPAR